MRTLVKSEGVNDMDPELELGAEEYMERARRRAETKIIKSKIIYKVN